MVHALTEAHRVLTPDGTVVDLRPDRDPGNYPRRHLVLEFWSGRRRMLAGTMPESPEYHGDYIASDRAVERVVRDGLFLLQYSEAFWLRAYFRDLSSLERLLATEWAGTTLPGEAREVITKLAARHPRGRIAAADLFRLNILSKPVWVRG